MVKTTCITSHRIVSIDRYGIWLVGTRSIVEVDRFKHTQDHALHHMQQTARFHSIISFQLSKRNYLTKNFLSQKVVPKKNFAQSGLIFFGRGFDLEKFLLNNFLFDN